MTLRQYLLTMAVATALSWVAWALVLMHVDPLYASVGGFFFFYASLFLSLVGTLAIMMFAVRAKMGRQPLFRSVEKSFHDAIGLAALLVSLLALRGALLLRVWNFMALLMSIGIFILFRWNARRVHTVSVAAESHESL